MLVTNLTTRVLLLKGQQFQPGESKDLLRALALCPLFKARANAKQIRIEGYTPRARPRSPHIPKMWED